MKILYIDTTTGYLYTGIVCDDVLLAEVKKDCGKDLSSVALFEIANMLESINMKPSDIDKIMVVAGPGSFTGIRIGITMAKTLAFSLKKAITIVSSLQAMALSSKKDEEYIVPIIDARRGFVYGAIYDNNGNVVLKDQYISLESLKVALNNLIDDYVIIGKYSNLETEEYDPDILKIVSNLKNKESINPHLVNPIYLKKTEAEESKEEEII